MNSTGYYALKWRYVKDGSGDDGYDKGWVDYVQWTGASPAQDPANWEKIIYKYDTGGRRTEKRVDGYSTRYLYDGGNVIAEYDGNGNLLRKYIHGPCVDEPICMLENPASDGIDVAANNAVYYYHYDALGSVVALSDSNGDSVHTYEYSVYGQVAASDPNFTANPYMFTGRRFDFETGLYYYRARFYNPYIGRFLQTDPVGYGAGMNLYAYCRNNPANMMDPSGNIPPAFDVFGYFYDRRSSKIFELTGEWNLDGMGVHFSLNAWEIEEYEFGDDKLYVYFGMDVGNYLPMEDPLIGTITEFWEVEPIPYSVADETEPGWWTELGVLITLPSFSGGLAGGGHQLIWIPGQGWESYAYGQVSLAGGEASYNVGFGIVTNIQNHEDYTGSYGNFSMMAPVYGPISAGFDWSAWPGSPTAMQVTIGFGGGASFNYQHYIITEDAADEIIGWVEELY